MVDKAGTNVRKQAVFFTVASLKLFIVAHQCSFSGRNRCFLPSFGSFGQAVSGD